ncbi:hypothetical protein J4573_52130 [Actinomadura barringtoniae]|uniref:Lipoprotein n=1 Tax=Actinomadura barringtoniae TaxID=1427535 RepID=A0A939T753_9ACTN|nr:hypothetical protein [Actinomadura barringtoniae]MBO2455706.1 hypothetical protein [Actinomadura barringtoniae]
MTRRLRRPHLAALLLVPALTLTACGGGGGDDKSDTAQPPAAADSATPSTGSSSSTSGGTTSGNGGSGGGQQLPANSPVKPGMTKAPKQVVSSFALCMRKHGFNVPNDVKSWKPPAGTDKAKAQAAMADCFNKMVGN